NADLKAQIQEKVFSIAALKNDLRKLKGNNVDTKFAKPSIFGKPVLQSLRNQSVVRQLNAFKSERPQMSKPRFASQVDVSNNLSRPVTQHYFSKRRKCVFAKPDYMIASSESRNSFKNMPRFSSNDMVHKHYLDESREKTQERDRNSKTSVMSSARFQSTADGSKPKPRSTNHSTRSLPVYVDILNIHDCKQTLDVSVGTSINVQKEQSLDLSAGCFPGGAFLFEFWEDLGRLWRWLRMEELLPRLAPRLIRDDEMGGISSTNLTPRSSFRSLVLFNSSLGTLHGFIFL
nr:hypothetical protein [Tanacetum cinerariifolium]